MNGFEKRKDKGLILENYLKEFLSANGIDYFNTGYEGLQSVGDARQKIKYNNTNTSFFVRHYPDVTMSSRKDSFLIEVKNSTGIERDCFNNYKSLSNHLKLNVMLLLKDKRIYNIQDIVFKKLDGYDFIAKMNIPIADEIWKEPRKMSKSKYNQYLRAYDLIGRYTSGCSFAFIDFNKSKGYDLDILKQIDEKYS